jgi:glucose/mannose-6-phosphate isomerase
VSRYEAMFELVGELGAQLREGYAAGQAGLGGAPAARPRTATISALGGSAIGGSLAEALWRDVARTPLSVNRSATLPGWIGPDDLVLPVSYSGATAETLAAARSALERGAAVIAVTAGEPLGGLVSAAGGQVVRVRGGLPPRAALGILFGALAAALEHAGAVPTVADDIRAAAHACDAVARDRGGSLASALGESVATTTTWVYGSGPLAAFARRFKSQLNENAKSTAAFCELPEADHNEIVGWAGTGRTGGRHAAIHLADPDDPPTIRASIATTPRLIDGDATLRRVLTGEGQTRTARAFWLLSLLDHASVYTARSAGVDPFEIDRIAELKQALAAATSQLRAGRGD